MKRCGVQITILFVLLVFTACTGSIEAKDLAKINYQGESFTEVNKNVPQFTKDEIKTELFAK